MSTPPGTNRGLRSSRNSHDGLISISLFLDNLSGVDNGGNEDIRHKEENMGHLLSNGDASSNTFRALDLGSCPFFNHGAALCQAALTPRTPPREVRASVCGCQDYEDCTTFLVRLLNRPGS